MCAGDVYPLLEAAQISKELLLRKATMYNKGSMKGIPTWRTASVVGGPSSSCWESLCMMPPS